MDLGTDEPSLHLTVGAEMGSKDADFTVFGQAGGNAERGNGARIWKVFQKALAKKVKEEKQLRRTVPRAFLAGQEENRNSWKDELREILHGIVDEMFDNDRKGKEEVIGSKRLRLELRKFREEMKGLM
jgi:hypothetical protein